MDATVDQYDGYRFVYCLPFSDDEVLVEDTYYSDGPELPKNEILERIEAYIVEHAWDIETVILC